MDAAGAAARAKVVINFQVISSDSINDLHRIISSCGRVLRDQQGVDDDTTKVLYELS